jgi:hypothetical protein
MNQRLSAGLRIALRLSAVDHAATEACSRLAVAQRDAAAAAERERARAALKVVERLIEHYRLSGKAMRDLEAVGAGMVADVTALYQLGISHPSHERVMVNGHRCVATALAHTPWKRYFSPLLNPDRTTFDEQIDKLSRRLRAANSVHMAASSYGSASGFLLQEPFQLSVRHFVDPNTGHHHLLIDVNEPTPGMSTRGRCRRAMSARFFLRS